MEAEKQVKFLQGCVGSAFAERDHSIMEVTTFSPLKVSLFCLVHRRRLGFNANKKKIYIFSKESTFI